MPCSVNLTPHWVYRGSNGDVGLGELVLPLGSVEELASVTWTWESWYGGMTNSATTEAQILGFELANSKIFFTYKLMEYVKGPNLQNHIYRISRVIAGYPRGVSVRVQ